MTILIADNLAKSFGARLIFKSITFSVGQGERMCVIGRNGEGKTTLLRVLAGELEQDAGTCQVVGKRSFGYLSQDVPTFSQTVLEEMLSSRKDIQDLTIKMKVLEERMATVGSGKTPEVTLEDVSSDTGLRGTGAKTSGYAGGRVYETKCANDELASIMDDYSRATARFEAIGGYTLEPRAKAILSGLGFTNPDFDKSPDVLSGGERIRLALAKLLLLEPDLLLLDEPTNHLDLSGIEWLEGFLLAYPGAVLMVSHDRYFMDKVAGKILELDSGEGKVYSGNYSAYLTQKELETRVQQESYERQQELIARTKAFIQKWKATPTRKNQAWSRQKMLDRMELVDKPKHERRAMGVRFDLEVESGDEVLLVRDLGRRFGPAGSPDPASSADRLGYTDPASSTNIESDSRARSSLRTLFHNFTWMVRKGDRVALIGPNGCGKTTLLRCILGQDDGYEGEVRFGQNVVTGYFSQGIDDLNDDFTLVQEVRELGLDNQEARDLLGRFLFSGEEAEKKIGLLSGGERNRLALAKMVVSKANVLFLDEPTNHLDMASREVLESAVRDFPGTLIFASHDRYFIDRLATHLWLFDHGTIHVFKGTYSDYRAKIESGVQIEFEEDLPSFALISGKPPKQAGAGRSGDDKRPGSPIAARRAADTMPGSSGLYTSSRVEREAKAREKAKKDELAALEDRIDRLEKRWDELVAALNDPATYKDSGGAELKEYKDVERELESLYEKWEELAHDAAGSKGQESKKERV